MNIELPDYATLHQLCDPIDCNTEQSRHISSVLPAISAALHAPVSTRSHRDPEQLATVLHIPTVERAVVVFIDGLGFWNLATRIGHAPNLRAMLRHNVNTKPIYTTQPSTTSVAIPAFGTGTTPGYTGMFGYTQRNPATLRKAQMISFTDNIDPHEIQQQPSVFAQLMQQGIRVTSVGLPKFEHSALTAAALAGADFIGSISPRIRLKRVLEANQTPGLTYLYIRDLDKTAHHNGWDCEPWIAELERIDTVIGVLRRSLSAGTLLVVTADHGAVNMIPDQQIDIAQYTQLQAGVELVAGEPRAPMLYTTEGERDRVAERWKNILADRAQVMTQDEALAAGVFGPVEERTLAWIGDVIVLATGQTTIVDSRTQQEQERSMPAVHGSRTRIEFEIPLLLEVL